ncbi:response regulator [Nibricoccus sp. IMCC34717]|uniref:response regulator n=1 Tax=Nibricoccus sp. IMCC34717 TaxID=3034021 RepID=UPI00384B74CD
MATLLVLHQDPLFHRVAGKAVSRSGHKCLTAGTEADAWQILRSRVLIDLVVLDAEAAEAVSAGFLKNLREDVLFAGIPVVVYLGQVERTTIFRYAELGVQAMLAKPLKADALQEEVVKAEKADWIGKLIDSEKAVCSRLWIEAKDYYSLLNTAAIGIEKALPDLKTHLPHNAEDERARKFLRLLFNQSNELGLPGLRSAAANMGKALSAVDEAGVRKGLAGIETMGVLMRRCVHAYLKVHDHLEVQPTPIPSMQQSEERLEPEADQFARMTLTRPMASLAGHLDRFIGRDLLNKDAWREIIGREIANGSMADLSDLVSRVFRASSAGREEAVSDIGNEPGLREVFLGIAQKLGDWSEDAEVDEVMAVDWLGIDRTLLIAAVARFARVSPEGGPLNLRALRLHTMVLTLLAYETASLLKLREPQLAAAAALASDSGAWLAATTEPVLWAMALAEEAQTGRPRHESEIRYLGTTLAALGSQFVDTARSPEEVRQVLKHWKRPETEWPAAITGPLVALSLAEPLVWAAFSSKPDALAEEAHRQLHAEAHRWQAWTRAGLTLPIDLQDLARGLVLEAKSCAWVGTTLLTWAEGQR